MNTVSVRQQLANADVDQIDAAAIAATSTVETAVVVDHVEEEEQTTDSNAVVKSHLNDAIDSVVNDVVAANVDVTMAPLSTAPKTSAASSSKKKKAPNFQRSA